MIQKSNLVKYSIIGQLTQVKCMFNFDFETPADFLVSQSLRLEETTLILN